MTGAYPQRVDEIVQLAHKQLDRPEVGTPIGEVRAAPIAQLVVVDDSPAIMREIRERQEVVVRRAGAAMENDQRRWSAGVVRTQVARDAKPRVGDLIAEIERNRALSHFLRYGAHRANLHRATESGPL